MKIVVHWPRPVEASVTPMHSNEIEIQPKFYRRTGMVPVLHITTHDVRKKEERYVLSVSAASGQLKIERLIEVVPLCDDKPYIEEGGSNGTATTE